MNVGFFLHFCVCVCVIYPSIVVLGYCFLFLASFPIHASHNIFIYYHIGYVVVFFFSLFIIIAIIGVINEIKQIFLVVFFLFIIIIFIDIIIILDENVYMFSIQSWCSFNLHHVLTFVLTQLWAPPSLLNFSDYYIYIILKNKLKYNYHHHSIIMTIIVIIIEWKWWKCQVCRQFTACGVRSMYIHSSLDELIPSLNSIFSLLL